MYSNNWYNRVTKNLWELPNAINYYSNELELAIPESKITGSLERNSQELSGIMANRFGQLQEIEAILKYLNIQYDRIRSKFYKKFLETYNRELTDRAIEKYLDGTDEVVEMLELINEIALIRNRYLALIKALEVKHYQIGNISKLRAVGLEDATLN